MMQYYTVFCSKYKRCQHVTVVQMFVLIYIYFENFQLCVTIICLMLLGVFGRKCLLILSGFGMSVALNLLIIGYGAEETDHYELWSIIIISIYIFFHSIGYGTVPWILMPEMCPRKVGQHLFKFIRNFKNSCSKSIKNIVDFMLKNCCKAKNVLRSIFSSPLLFLKLFIILVIYSNTTCSCVGVVFFYHHHYYHCWNVEFMKINF